MTKLQQRMREELRLRNSSPETIDTYIGCVERFARYYGQNPEQMKAEQVRSYLLYLLSERKRSWPALPVARAALRFLSVRVLKQHWFDEEIPCPKRPVTLPDVLSAEEITRILEHTRNLKHGTMLAPLYATGLRSKELRLLKVSDIDSPRCAHNPIFGPVYRRHSVPVNLPRPTVAEIFRQHKPEFLERWGHTLSDRQTQTLRDLGACRTAALGAHLHQCADCPREVIVYNSCLNRHGPQCGSRARDRWLVARSEELLPVPYSHVVFTLPHELIPLARQTPAWFTICSSGRPRKRC